jgi:hypothetical protein
MRWVLVIVGGILGAVLLHNLLPHKQNTLPQIELRHEGGASDRSVRGTPAVPVVTTTAKCGVTALGLLLLFSFRNSERVQTAALLLITSGGLALLGQAFLH